MTAPRSAGGDLVPAAAGALAALCALAWAGAALAAAATGHRLPPIEATGSAVVRLPATLGDPAAAWPVSAQLPGPVEYWVAQATVAVVVVVGGAALLRLRPGPGRRGSLGVASSVGLGRGSDLRRLAVRRPPPGRLVLGRVGRRLVAAEEQASVAVVGPTGCGKTAGLVIPALLEWRGPVLATSVKGDLVEATLGHRAGRGRVWVYDPTGASGATAAGWSPLAACRSWAGAQRVAAWLCEGARPSGGSLADADYWYGQARKALAPYLHAAAMSDRTMADVVRWIDLEEVAAVDAVLSRAVPDVDAATGLVEVWPLGNAPALAAARSLWRKEERLRSSILATVENVIAGYADPGVAALDAAGLADGGIDLEEWLSGDNTIYVVAAAHDQARLRPVLAVLVADALRRAFDRANATGGKLVRPCLAMLDEAGTIAPVAELPTWAATARSHGISLVTVWQDLAQLRARYGPTAATVLNNHRAKVFGGGIADGGTLDYLSGLVGEERVVERTTSADVVGERRSMSEHVSWRRAAPPDALRRLGTRQALLVYGAELPVRLTLRPWFADRRLRALGTAIGF